jgi:hypothetical protein
MCKDGVARRASRNIKLLFLVIIVIFYSSELHFYHLLLIKCVCHHLLMVLSLCKFCFLFHGVSMCKDGTTRSASRNANLLLLVIIIIFYSNEQLHIITFFGFVVMFLLITTNISFLNFLMASSFFHCISENLQFFSFFHLVHV